MMEKHLLTNSLQAHSNAKLYTRASAHARLCFSNHLATSAYQGKELGIEIVQVLGQSSGKNGDQYADRGLLRAEFVNTPDGLHAIQGARDRNLPATLHTRKLAIKHQAVRNPRISLTHVQV
jgi:hypothetical protein